MSKLMNDLMEMPVSVVLWSFLFHSDKRNQKKFTLGSVIFFDCLPKWNILLLFLYETQSTYFANTFYSFKPTMAFSLLSVINDISTPNVAKAPRTVKLHILAWAAQVFMQYLAFCLPFFVYIPFRCFYSTAPRNRMISFNINARVAIFKKSIAFHHFFFLLLSPFVDQFIIYCHESIK